MKNVSKNPIFHPCGDIQGVTDPNDEKFLCFIKCSAEKSGMLTPAGEPNANAVANFLFPDEMKDKITMCLKRIQKVNTCADMKPFMNCFR